jgi:hypothetical protein
MVFVADLFGGFILPFFESATFFETKSDGFFFEIEMSNISCHI